MLRIVVLGSLCLAGCNCSGNPEADATLGVKEYVERELAGLEEAVRALKSAAPAPDPDGWNATADREAVDAMRAHWARARAHYERIEGAIAVLFPHLDESMDERYDAFIELMPDDDPFDREGVTGMHAIERILWAGEHPAPTLAFERGLTNYRAAAFPSNAEQARSFRDELVERLLEDIRTMRGEFAPLALDPAAAYRGVVGSMQEQLEKVTLAATGQDESRYSAYTLADMRANRDGGLAIYAVFRPWIRAIEGGDAIDDRIAAGFARLDAAYAPFAGNSLPPVPDGWNPDAPSAADLATPYGRLWAHLSRATDPRAEGSLVAEMNRGGDAIGIAILP